IPFAVTGTAINNTNYSNLIASPLIIPAGQTSANITGNLIDDGKYDASNKTMIFTLGSPANATLGPTTTNTLTINESDPQPTVSFASATQLVNENAGTFAATVTLSAPSNVDTTVPFNLDGTAVSGTNYSNPTASPLVIPAGQTSASITGTLIND